MITLDRTDDAPLYRQLRDAITNAIQSGHYHGGELLPSSRGLATELGISRNTVNAAYQELVAEGFLESVPRRGLRVSRELRAHLRNDDAKTAAVVGMDWTSRTRQFTEDIGEVSKPADWDRYPYPFVVGQPDDAEFPTRSWSRALRSALSGEHKPFSLHDLVDQDDPLLLEMITERILPARGISADTGEVLTTMGSQHGIALLSDALLGDGSLAAVEEPGYPDARQIFRRSGAELRPLPVDAGGLTLATPGVAGADLVFVTPSHHYPTNVTMAIGRRHQLLAEAATHDVVVVEDDYDSEFRYLGTPTPALKALDRDGRVVYVGSFSKFLAPGLRLGFIVADRSMIEQLRARRRYAIRHVPGVIQRSVAIMIQRGDYQRALRRSRKLLKTKWEQLVTSVESHLGFVVAPTGGLSVWIEGPPRLDADRLSEAALDEGIVIEPGSSCFLARPAPRHYFKLGFSAIPHDSIDAGVARLAAVMRTAGTS